MKKEIKAYLEETEIRIKGREGIDEAFLSEMLTRIGFYQHERLIHLIVTVLFAILTFAVFFLLISLPVWNTGLLILLIALLVLLIPYIFHYYTLENGVQKMYKQYDEILKRIRT